MIQSFRAQMQPQLWPPGLFWFCSVGKIAGYQVSNVLGDARAQQTVVQVKALATNT